MGKRDKKKKREKKKGTAAEKAEARQDKAAKKQAKKQKDGDEEDIEKLIAEFKKKDSEKTAVTESINPPPAPRFNATFLPVPGKDNELFLYGGESFEEDRVVVYNDLFRYNLKRSEWKKIESPNSPAPRCSHQAVCSKNFMYIFGGEFTSPSQSQFYHYRDTWKLNVDTNQWTEIQTKGNSPPARSGHRMQLWKRKIILFGGFFDIGSETRYFNDIWAFDIDSEKWTKIEPKNAISGNIPAPRSGCITGIHGDYFYVLRGYSLEKKTKDSAPKGTVHNDAWVFHLVEHTWEKIKTPGRPPSIRSGMASVVDRTRILTFGGVYDEDTKDNMTSTFYDDMYQFHMDSRRWFPLALNRKRKQKEGEDEALDDADELAEDEKEEKEEEKEVKREKEKEKEKGKEKEESDDEEKEEDEEEEEERGKGKGKGKKKGKGKRDEPKEENEEKGKGKGKGKGKEKGKGKDKGDKGEKEEPTKAKGKGKDKEAEKETKKGKGKETAPETKKPEEPSVQKSSPASPIPPLSPSPSPSPSTSSTTTTTTTTSTAKLGQSTDSTTGPKLGQSTDLASPKLGLSTESSLASSVTSGDEAIVGPGPRISSHLALIGHTLYLYGGVVEKGDREVIHSDLYSLNLHKLDNFECLIESQAVEWDAGAEGDDDDDDDDDDEDEDEEDSEEEEEEEGEEGEASESEEEGSDSAEEPEKVPKAEGKSEVVSAEGEGKGEENEEEEGEEEGSEEEEKVEHTSSGGVVNVKSKKQLVRGRYGKREKLRAKLAKFQEDGTPTPNPRETLREFFDRTSESWAPFVIAKLRPDQHYDTKELRREGFLLAEVRYNNMRPLMEKIEKLDEEEEEARKQIEKKKAYESRSIDVRVKEKLKEKKEKSRR